LLHHERWDGGGYPTGRTAREIPLAARVVAIADALAAMTAARPHRAALPVRGALERLRDGSGSQFDPELTGALLDAVAAGDVDLEDRAAIAPERAPAERFPGGGLVTSAR
nr:two-component system response regulator [Solirubrobacterales bacterium]